MKQTLKDAKQALGSGRVLCGVVRAEMLVAFAILAAGCGAPIVAENETTAGSVEQPVETTSTTDIRAVITERPPTVSEEAGSTAADTTTTVSLGVRPVDSGGQGSPGSTVVDTTTTVADTTTTASPILEYSPAWIEWQEIKFYLEGDSIEDLGIEDLGIVYNYMSGNPNDVSTPMGALCWSFHELFRSILMDFKRWVLDDHLIPFTMGEYGVTSEQVGNPGPEATEAFLDLMSGDDGLVESIDAGGNQSVLPGDNGGTAPVGSTGEVDYGSEDFVWELFRLEHEFAGDGNAWSDAVRAVASPEMAAAFRAGEGLPPDVQVYADALIAFAEDRVGREFDVSGESGDIDFLVPGFPGILFFVEAANYHQDCKRALLDDVSYTLELSSASAANTAVPTLS